MGCSNVQWKVTYCDTPYLGFIIPSSKPFVIVRFGEIMRVSRAISESQTQRMICAPTTGISITVYEFTKICIYMLRQYGDNIDAKKSVTKDTDE